MTVTVNGRPHETEAASLHDLLEELGFAGRKVATALNGDFVRASLRSETGLNDGDAVEVVVPMQGG
ncbi:MAG: sulfur carrier protein ThiS [Rhodospirillales bacterium]|nr:sulfur carrier protein ThiS [Rhodospirillales bacterium]